MLITNSITSGTNLYARRSFSRANACHRLMELSIELRLERKSALFFFTEVIWQRFCYNCPFCEKLTNIKPAWNISVFSTGFRVSVFLISSNFFMQVRINFFIWQACWQILHWSSILLSLYVGLVLKWQCWCLASHFEWLGLVCWFCRRSLSAHHTSGFLFQYEWLDCQVLLLSMVWCSHPCRLLLHQGMSALSQGCPCRSSSSHSGLQSLSLQ